MATGAAIVDSPVVSVTVTMVTEQQAHDSEKQRKAHDQDGRGMEGGGHATMEGAFFLLGERMCCGRWVVVVVRENGVSTCVFEGFPLTVRGNRSNMFGCTC